MNNQECRARPKVISINSNEPLFYPYCILVNRCIDSCNKMNDPKCVPDVFKNINVKVFNLISRTNETRHIKWNETCKCRVNENVCNNKER